MTRPLPPDCIEVARPSARIAARVDPETAARLAARAAEGSGAAIGPIRRIAAALIVCAGAAGGATVLVPRPAPPPVVKPAEAALDAQIFGARGAVEAPRALAEAPSVAVPAPASALVFVPAVVALLALRRRKVPVQVGGYPPAVPRSSPASARRGGLHRRAARLLARGLWR